MTEVMFTIANGSLRWVRQYGSATMTMPVTLPLIQGFRVQVDRGDDTARGALADFLEDRDDPWWMGLRALLQLGRQPHRTHYREVTLWGYHGGWGTYREELGHGQVELLVPGWAALPRDWYACCWSTEDLDAETGDPPAWMISGTRSGCDILAAIAFLRLPAERQESYLRGEVD